MVSAVITADIVNSTRLPEQSQRKLRATLHAVLQPFLFEFYRGDSFQVLVKDPRVALRLVLTLRTQARKISIHYDVRCSIAIGEISPRIRKLSTAADPAFVLSGRNLEKITNTEDRLIISSKDGIVNHGFNLIAYFSDYVINDITEAQAEVLTLLLQGKTQQEVSRKLRKSAPTINKLARAAGWHEIARILAEYDHFISILLHGNPLSD